MKRERTGSFPVGVNARLQEDRLHVIKRGKRMIATSGLDELLIVVEGRFVLDDRAFEMQKYLFPSFVGAVLRLARRATVRGALFWQPGPSRTSKITRRYLSTSDI
jgi:hypothetical protein